MNKLYKKALALAMVGLGIGSCSPVHMNPRKITLAHVKPTEQVNIEHYKNVEELIELARRQCQMAQSAFGSMVAGPMIKGCEELTNLAISEAKKLSLQSGSDTSTVSSKVLDDKAANIAAEVREKITRGAKASNRR